MDKFTGNASAMFDSWFKLQKEYMDNWNSAANSFQNTFKGMDWSKNTKSETQDVFGFYQSWKDTFGKYFDTTMKSYPGGVNTDTMSKLFGGADVYVKLYEFWEPLIKSIQESALDPESYKEMFKPEKYREMINNIFGFTSPEGIAEFCGQTSEMFETWGGKSHLFIKPWADAIQENMDSYTAFTKGDVEAGYNIFHNIYSAFEKTFGKSFKIPAVGKDRQEIELMLKAFDKYAVFLAKNTEFQHKIFITGQNAMEKVVESIAEKIKNGEEFTGFDQFFRLWAEVNEKDFLELFKTEEFAKLQGVVLDVSLDARMCFQQLLELYLEDFPIALRSEMNDVHKSVYTLKKNVRKILRQEKDAGELQKEVSGLKETVNAMNKKIKSMEKTLNAK